MKRFSPNVNSMHLALINIDALGQKCKFSKSANNFPINEAIFTQFDNLYFTTCGSRKKIKYSRQQTVKKIVQQHKVFL